MKHIKKVLRILCFLPYSVFFNFYYLPFKQAIKLPILFLVRPTFIALKGKVMIDAPIIKPKMIEMGSDLAPIVPQKTFHWENYGTIIFRGKTIISHHTFISVGSQRGILDIGKESSFSFGLRIICFKHISFGDNSRVSWDCTFIDTDLHPLIDIVGKHTIRQEAAIKMGSGCWIGHNVLVSKGVRLAPNTTVSSGSVVKNSSLTPCTLVSGNPATLIDEGYMRDDMYAKQEHEC